MASDRKTFENMSEAPGEIAGHGGLSKRGEPEGRRPQEKAGDCGWFNSDFLSDLSHEIRTPMNAVLGISEILLRGDQLTDQQKKYIGDIRNASESLLGVVGDILDLARLETAGLKPSPVHFNFRAMLNGILACARSRAKARGLTFAFEPEGEMPMYLCADDIRCRQVILGLLDSAMAFARTGSITLGAAVEGRRLRMTVAYTGPDLREEERPFIFDPFRLAEEGRSPGLQEIAPEPPPFRVRLNLALCRKLSALLGGELDLDSLPERGGLFRLTLPVEPGDESRMRPEARAADSSGETSARILIVDDDEVNLSVASGLLKSLYDLDSDLAGSGRQALDKIRRADYDLIFMDHMMPEMDGVETAVRIRALGGKFRDMPIIALTANVVIGNREKLLASGLSDYLSKPLRREELDDTLRKWLPGLREPSSATDGEGGETGPTPSSLINKLATLDMMDVNVGLKAVGGDADSYLRSLRILKGRIPGLLGLMDRLLKREDLAELSVHFHGLKGALAAVGGVGLARPAQNLENAAGSGDLVYVRNYMPSFARLLEKLERGLEDIFAEETGTGRPKLKGDRRLLESGLKALQAALEQHDSDAVDRGLRHLLRSDFGPEAERALRAVQEKIAAFEYEAGAEILRTAFKDML